MHIAIHAKYLNAQSVGNFDLIISLWVSHCGYIETIVNYGPQILPEWFLNSRSQLDIWMLASKV